MTKEVHVSVKGLQMEPGCEGESVVTISPGEYYNRSGKHFLLYEEVTEGFDQVTKNTIKACDGYLELTKKGVTNVHMVFEKGKKNVTYYYTPYGSLLMGIDTARVEITEQEDLLHIEVDYELELNYEHLAHCEIRMDVTPRSAKLRLVEA